MMPITLNLTLFTHRCDKHAPSQFTGSEGGEEWLKVEETRVKELENARKDEVRNYSTFLITIRKSSRN